MGELVALVGFAAVFSALAIASFGALIARRRRAKRRERQQAKTAAAFSFASKPDDIHRVALDAALEIVGGAGSGVALAISGGEPEIVATAGELLPWELGGFGHRASVALVLDGEPHGELWIHTREKLGRRALEDLETLAAHVVHALERVGVSRPEADDLLASAV